MLEFILGAIFGVAISYLPKSNPKKTVEDAKKIVGTLLPGEKAQFAEPKTFKEKFKEAKNITDLIK